MSLTKAALLDAAKPRVELIKADDVPGLADDVWVKSWSQTLQSSRGRECADERGMIDLDKRWMFQLIDQLCVDEDGTPMFEDADLAQLQQLDIARLDAYFDAIRIFNFGEKKTTQNGSTGTSKS